MATTTQYVFANFFETELISGLTAGSTTMMVPPSDAALLPIITAGSNTQAQVTIWDGILPPEIVAVTANDQSGTMTILRAQENTVPQAWAAGSQVRSALTALVINTALAAYFDFTQVLSAHYLSLAGGTLTGALNLAADPTVPLQAATKRYVDNTLGTGLPTSGGSMTGPINMNSNLINNLHDPGSAQDAATKNYVDVAVGPLAPKASPALTGVPTAPDPTGGGTTQIATKGYVDAAVGGVGTPWSAGDCKLTFKTVADTGWLMMDDTTIGSATSNATHQNNAYQTLFNLLWAIPACQLFSPTGTAISKTTLPADWNNSNSLAMPKALGRALAVAGAGAGLTSRPLGSTFGEENHVLLGHESVPHRHVAAVQTPEADVTDAQVLATVGGATNGLAEGNFTGTNVTRAITWAANSFGNTGPRLYDGGVVADRTSNALTLSDSVYFGHAGTTPPGNDVADGHNNVPPESYFNVMIKY